MEISADTFAESHTRVFGHFGEWLQGRLGPDGPVVLVSMSCPEFWCEVQVKPSNAFEILQTRQVLSENRIKECLDHLGVTDPVAVSLSGSIPIGAGLGASTASLAALIKAVKPTWDENKVTSTCLMIEGATDPLVFDQFDKILWASRKGQIVQNFSNPPKFEVIGGLWGDAETTDPHDDHFPDVYDLIPLWEKAACEKSLSITAALASESARRTTALRGPFNDPSEAVTTELNALGFTRAHTGSARGFLFAPGKVPAIAMDHLRGHGYTHLTRFLTGA